MIETIVPLLERADASVAPLMEAQRKALATAAESAGGLLARNQIQATVLVGLGLILGAFVLVTIRMMTANLRRVAEEVESGIGSVAAAARQAAACSVSLARGASG
jgi:acyl-coenzyme A thioesterase PaaI-like protein